MATWDHRRGPLAGAILSMLVCIAGCFGLPVPARCAADASLEYEVKAAFLLNFTKFIEWPPTAFADSGSPFAICILGKDPFGQALDGILQGEAVGRRKLTIERISQPPAPQTCQLIFISVGAADFPKVLGSLGPGILTVGEGEGFVRGGGMIGFVIDHRRVRFDINSSAAEGAGLKLSSKLLAVARSIEK